MVRRNKPSYHTPYEEIMTKTVWTVQSNTESRSSIFQVGVAFSMEDSPRLPCQVTASVQINGRTRSQLSGTTTRSGRWRTRMENRIYPRFSVAPKTRTVPNSLERVFKCP